MALSVQLYIEPTVSHHRMLHANAQASRKIQNHETTIKRHSHKLGTTYVRRRLVRRVEKSVSTAEKLVACVESGYVEDALKLFEQMDKRSTFVWNVMIRGLVDSGLFEQAIFMYSRMRHEGHKPDRFTFPSVIKACGEVCGFIAGQIVHNTIIKLGFAADVYTCNALIIMYAKLGWIEASEKIFARMPIRDVASWNSMISGYVAHGDGLISLTYFREMIELGVKHDRFSFISALGACCLERCLMSGKEIFGQMLRNGIDMDPMIQSSLIDMFGKCGKVDYAERFCNTVLEKNVVVWNSMLGAYILNDKPMESFACLDKMMNVYKVTPDAITFIHLLHSCAKLGAFKQGKMIHGHSIRKAFLPHLVLETTLLDVYGKFGYVTQAERVFLQMTERNLVSWNAMIAAYAQNNHHKEAINKFRTLPFVPDDMTFLSILPTYSEIALPREGKQVHCQVHKLGIARSTCVSNALVHMYAKCGDLKAASKVFDSILCKDVISWNTMIGSFAIHGYATQSINTFSDMIGKGNLPNESTFVSLLSACSIAGYIDEGWKYFNSMQTDYSIDPGIEHYGCILDLLGRAGELERAKQFIDEMPLMPTPRIWGSLLSASRYHGNIEMAEFASKQILSMDDNDNTGCYVLLSNMYAEAGKWDRVERIQRLMKEKGVQRTAALSIVDHSGEIYKFANHEKSRAKPKIVYDVLDILSRKIDEKGCVKSVSKFRPLDLIKARDGGSPMFHSVRLAVCFGLVSTPIGEPVLVRKNVRICDDCHSALKKISGYVKREIVVGDSKIYHHFKDGRCSCIEYW